MRTFTQALTFLTLFLAFSGCALAGEGSDPLFELHVTGHAGRGKGRSLLATQLYAEKALPLRDVSVFLVANRDQEFRSVYLGLARQFGDLQLGLGAGNAWYDGRRHATVNPWLYWERDGVEAFTSAERYAREDKAPWFYKGYVRARIGDAIFAGVHGEKDFGIGPLIGWAGGNVKLWSAVPLVGRAKEGARLVAGVQVEF